MNLIDRVCIVIPLGFIIFLLGAVFQAKKYEDKCLSGEPLVIQAQVFHCEPGQD
jgi:hypothetical protein